MNRNLHLIAALVLSATACVTEGDGETEIEQEILAYPCPRWSCGSNSPEIDSFGFHDLNENGFPNDAGFRLQSFKKAGITYSLDVTKMRLQGLHATLPPLQGPALVNAVIYVTNDVTGHTYAIRIAGVDSVPMWADPSQLAETYRFEWKTIGGQKPYRNVCSNPPINGGETLGMNTFHTILFENDWIRADTKTVHPDSPTWFNIGCAGHALAKLALTGHANAAGSAFGLVTTIDQRQTMLKLITGDYCGIGMPFTVAGEPLQWIDDNAWMGYPPGPAPALEARWTPNGASCLSAPRLASTTSALAPAAFPGGIEVAIADHCVRPPPCADPDPYEFDGHHLVSANPP